MASVQEVGAPLARSLPRQREQATCPSEKGCKGPLATRAFAGRRAQFNNWLGLQSVAGSFVDDWLHRLGFADHAGGQGAARDLRSFAATLSVEDYGPLTMAYHVKHCGRWPGRDDPQFEQSDR